MTQPTDQSSREQEREATLKDIRWRINDVRDMLIESKAFNGERLYGIDEWSTPAVNLASAIAKLDALIATLPPTAITAEEAGREGEAHVPYLCIAPVCGGHCGDCAYAIGPQEQRDYALRYAHLRTMQQSGCGVFEFQGNGEPNPNGILLGGHLDSFVDAELSAMKLPPAPAQSGGQG